MIFLVKVSRSKRTSTVQQSEEMQKREKERRQKMKERMMTEIAARKNMAAVRRLTQQELLEEAKLTEQINLKSLGNVLPIEVALTSISRPTMILLLADCSVSAWLCVRLSHGADSNLNELFAAYCNNSSLFPFSGS